MKDFETISVIGLGYIGLPTAAALATQRKKVIGVDINQSAVDTINQGKIHIVEPELDVAVQAAVSRGFLRASVTPEPADAFLIAVPTPFKDNYQPDLSYIKSSINSIAPVLKKGDVIILESTSPVGTTAKLAEWLARERPDLSFPQQKGENSDIRIAYCPERVLPGQVMFELVKNDRVVGGMTPRCAREARDLYLVFVKGACFETDAATAEMCKLTENAVRDVNIAFANEISIVCEKLDINVWEMIKLANQHPRINILQPGPGVGGHCIAVDPWFIISQSPDETPLMRTAREVNDGKPAWVIDQVKLAVANFLNDNPGRTMNELTIGCFGLAFKADIDDLRESPALKIALKLSVLLSAHVKAVEPHIDTLPDLAQDHKLELVSMQDALETSDVILLLVDHSVFKEIPIQLLKEKVVVDTRGLWHGA